MLRFVNLLALLLVLALVHGCGGVSDNDDEDSGDSGGGITPPPETGPFPPLDAVVEVSNGLLRGVRIVIDGVMHYQAIPYAAAPIAEKRWRAPLPALDWVGILDATAPGAACIQGDTRDRQLQSEDCLFINVAAPEGETDSRRPVMVWFHGGGDDNGSGTQVPYDIAGLAAASGNVVVSVNARLGFLGFLALPGFRLESAEDGTGNYHHLDQVAALQWVGDNIAVFNGNPNNVTLFGESSGGNGVCRHLSSPLSAGLFHRAILQSSSCGPIVMRTLVEGYVQGERYKEIWGCASAEAPLDCMRQQSALDLRQALRNAGKANDLLGGNLLDQEIFWPVAVIDDYAFNATPYEALVESPANIGVVIGVTRNEATLFLQSAGNSNPDSLASYQEAVKQVLPGLDDADVLFITTILYPLIDYGTYSNAFADVMGDVFFACPSVATADVLAAGGHSVRFYQFSRAIQDDLLLAVVGPLDPNAPDLGIPHSAELFYLWDLATMQAGPLPGLTVNAVQPYWSRFAASGVPVADDQPDWPLYSIDGGEYLDIGIEIEDVVGFKLEKCNFLNSRQIR